MVTITINSVNVTDHVPWDSIRIENILTQQVDRCTFKIRKFGTQHTYRPVPGRQVVISDSGTTVFGGVITKITEQSIANNILEFLIECSDYTRLLDQHLVAETYEAMTVNEIIADIIANFCPTGITGANVDCDQEIDFIQFKYEPVSYCLKQLADLVGYDWYIDYSKDIHFQAPSAEGAPIDLTDDGGVYDMNSLIIRRDNTQVRNSVIVRGGQYLGTEFTAVGKADGKNVVFLLPYQYEDFKIRVNGVIQNLGVDYIDDADNFDALYNFNEKLVRWRSNNKPAQDATLSYSGKPYLPVIVKLSDPVSQQSIYSAEQGLGDGYYEYLVIDKSINSKEGARARALAEIMTYGSTLSEGEFTTESSGLKAGQQILIDSDSRGMNEYFIINRVVSVMKDATSMKYQVSLITTKTMDFMTLIKKILIGETKKIEIKANEVLDLIVAPNEIVTIVESLVASKVHNPQDETVTISEGFQNNGLNFGKIFVLGPYTPSGLSDTKAVFILNGSLLG